MVKKAKIEPSPCGKKGQNRTVPNWSFLARAIPEEIMYNVFVWFLVKETE